MEGGLISAASHCSLGSSDATSSCHTSADSEGSVCGCWRGCVRVTRTREQHCRGEVSLVLLWPGSAQTSTGEGPVQRSRAAGWASKSNCAESSRSRERRCDPLLRAHDSMKGPPLLHTSAASTTLVRSHTALSHSHSQATFACSSLLIYRSQSIHRLASCLRAACLVLPSLLLSTRLVHDSDVRSCSQNSVARAGRGYQQSEGGSTGQSQSQHRYRTTSRLLTRSLTGSLDASPVPSLCLSAVSAHTTPPCAHTIIRTRAVRRATI